MDILDNSDTSEVFVCVCVNRLTYTRFLGVIYKFLGNNCLSSNNWEKSSGENKNMDSWSQVEGKFHIQYSGLSICRYHQK